MANVRTIKIRAGDTEPLEIPIDATNLTDLSGLSAAVLYMKKEGASTNHVDGAALTVASSSDKTLRFDPVNNKNPSGNAFDAAGDYRGYVKATWSDGDITRHPGDPDVDLQVIVSATLE